MNKLIKRSSEKVGLAPGSVVYIGKQKVDKTHFHVIDYSKKKIVNKDLKKVEEFFSFKKSPTISWLDITGLHETENITKLGSYFDLHPLIQEDIVNTSQRPSFEDFQKYFFISLKMLSIDEEITVENVSLIVGKNYVISFQERLGDVFSGVRKRIFDKRKIIERGSDYLAYALIDSIVDHYFIVLENIGDRIEKIEEELNESPSQETFKKMNKLKRDLIYIRKSVWPLREVLNQFKKSESKLIDSNTKTFINDVYDHTIQIIDTVESLRDVTSSMTDLYLSIISNRMNEIMKVLTIFAAIFIPLTFVAGVYGMNFVNIPELQTKYGYFFVWGVFLMIGFGMLYYFRKKDWI